MSTGKKSSFLDIDDNIIKKQLLLEGSGTQELDSLFPTNFNQRAAIIKPKPGLCVKTRDDKQNKLFINVCTSEAIPVPEDISDQELITILESEEPSDFRVPMSIGQPHEEKDKSGETCTAYDVVISPQFLTKMSNNPLFSNFFMIATLEGIEEKYKITLDKNGWTVLKNKKYHGNMPEQAVRTTMPLVQELSGVRQWKSEDIPGPSSDTSKTSSPPSQPLITEVSTKLTDKVKPEKIKPKFSLQKTSLDSEKRLQAKVELPDMVTGNGIDVTVGEDRLVVETRKNLLDVFVPFSLDISRSDAHFVTSSKVLIVRAPILSS